MPRGLKGERKGRGEKGEQTGMDLSAPFFGETGETRNSHRKGRGREGGDSKPDQFVPFIRTERDRLNFANATELRSLPKGERKGEKKEYLGKEKGKKANKEGEGRRGERT